MIYNDKLRVIANLNCLFYIDEVSSTGKFVDVEGL